MDIDAYKPGTFCWADLATTDAQAAKQFYAGIFGWTIVDIPMGGDLAYCMFKKGDKNVCALYQMTPEMGDNPYWMPYISVTAVDATAARASELGGSVLMGPADIFDSGRVAVIQDPTEAVVALWQPKEHIGAQVFGEPSALGWDELMTRDTAGAAEFYGALLGWTTRLGGANPEMEYTEFQLDNESVAGMMEIQPEWGPTPPHWTVYFVVDDCDGTLKRAKELGGSVTVPPMDIAGVGRIAYVAEPQSGHFAIIQMAGG